MIDRAVLWCSHSALNFCNIIYYLNSLSVWWYSFRNEKINPSLEADAVIMHQLFLSASWAHHARLSLHACVWMASVDLLFLIWNDKLNHCLSLLQHNITPNTSKCEIPRRWSFFEHQFVASREDLSRPWELHSWAELF